MGIRNFVSNISFFRKFCLLKNTLTDSIDKKLIKIGNGMAFEKAM